MAKAKKIIGIILLSIGLFIIILFSMFSIRYKYIYYTQFITGVFLFVIGLVFIRASRKKISAANEKKIAGIILLSIGSIIITGFGLLWLLGAFGYLWFLGLQFVIIGLVIFLIGLILLLTSRKNANAKKIVGIILLVIGLFIIIMSSVFSIVYKYIYILPIIIGVVPFVIGLILLLTSRKKNSKSLDKSMT